MASGAQPFRRHHRVRTSARRFAIVLDNRVHFRSGDPDGHQLGGSAVCITGNVSPRRSAGQPRAVASLGCASRAAERDLPTPPSAPNSARTPCRSGTIALAIGAAAIVVFILLAAYGLFGVFAAAALIAERADDRRHHVPYPGDADPAGHRRPDPDPGRGGGRERPDLRADAGRGAGGTLADPVHRLRAIRLRAGPRSSTPTSPR